MQEADHMGQYSRTFFLEALRNLRVSKGAAQRRGNISPKLRGLTGLHRHLSTCTIGCSAPSPLHPPMSSANFCHTDLHRHRSTCTIRCSAPSRLQPIDSLNQCLLPTSASSHGSKTSGKQVCIEINAEQQRN